MKVLIACEWSGTLRDAFRSAQHEAYSIDLLGSDDLPEEFANQIFPQCHIKGDIRDVIDSLLPCDLLIAHPPCTYLAVSGARWLKTRLKEQEAALKFVRYLMDLDVPRIAIENPISVISTKIRKPDQVVQPWWFGDPEPKSTCWWIKNLPLLKPTHIVKPDYVRNAVGQHRRMSRMRSRQDKKRSYFFPELAGKPISRVFYGYSKDNGRLRGRTYKGMALAIVDQWGRNNEFLGSEAHKLKGFLDV